MTEQTAPTVLDYFPLEKPRRSQVLVINEVDKAFKSGKKIVIVEAPVGSGKSAMAITFARALGGGYILTPRKSLQDQYFDDFHDHVSLMKGRNSYPCVHLASPNTYRQIKREIENGNVVTKTTMTCAEGPCRGDVDVYKECTSRMGPCPYSMAITTAQSTPIVIHNMHSFIYQTQFTEKFEPRNLLVVDEVHELEGMLREFLTSSITVGVGNLTDLDKPRIEDNAESWADYLSQDKFLPKLTQLEIDTKAQDPDYQTSLDTYLNNVEALRRKSSRVVASRRQTPPQVSSRMTTWDFTPVSLGTSAKDVFFDMAGKVLLMSGTIYDKAVFCSTLGINPDEAAFLRIGSTFPASNRPIYCRPDLQVDTSFANWNQNLGEILEKINTIVAKFPDVKGLIHAPSYDTAQIIAAAIKDGRGMAHLKSDFQSKLEEFYELKGNKVFVSPVCQQGVDFKNDRAVFQIIVRVPYMNTSDAFAEYQVKNNFAWYNHQALVTFGQQIGRINRSESDFGITFCLDSRFNKFISKNHRVIPKWVHEAIIYK